LHPRLLHVALAGMSSDGSSDSDSAGGAGERVGVGAWTAVCGARVPLAIDDEIGLGGGGEGCISSDGAGGGVGVGVSSTMECFPAVQGGMARNSSKVRTRGLQHFHPEVCSQHDSSINAWGF
jgi:hypothetical protein